MTGDEPPVWRLRFDDRPGLTVEVSVPTLEARALAPRLVPAFTSGREGAVLAAVAQFAAPFADSLVSWTATTPAGRPAPATRKGTVRVDVWLLLDVLLEWIKLWPPLAVPDAEPVEVEQDPEIALLASLPMVPLADDEDPAEPDAEPDAEPAELEAVS